MALIILAGGKASRMGYQDKALLPLGVDNMVGFIIKRLEPMFSNIFVVARDEKPYLKYKVKVVYDEYPGCGPIGGIHAGLKASNDRYNLILACDLPLVNKNLVQYLLKNQCKDAVVPTIGKYLEPLLAIYSKDILPEVERFIHNGQYRISDLLSALDVCYIPEKTLRIFDPELESFLNVNSPEDYEKVKKIISIREKI